MTEVLVRELNDLRKGYELSIQKIDRILAKLEAGGKIPAPTERGTRKQKYKLKLKR